MAFLPGSQPEHRAHKARFRGAIVLLAGALVLSACGSDSGNDVPEDRQFANDPAPTRQATDTPRSTPTEAIVFQQSGQPLATPADLLRTRGAPSSLYTVSDAGLSVLEIGITGVEARPIDVPEGAEVLGFAASPTGDRVGVLMLASDSETTFVRFYDRSGEELGEPFGLQAPATPAASPVATPMASPAAISAIPESDEPVSGTSISWIPQGNGVLVVRDNTLYALDVEQGVQVVPTDTVQGTLLHAAASPKGGEILMQTVDDDGHQTAWLVQQDSGETHELYALRTSPGQGISELSWLPTGNGVVFVKGDVVDGQVLRGQLYSYLLRNEVPRLVATYGQGGPSATIRNVAVSPDGNAVAYDVSIRDGDLWALHSLWIRSLKHESASLEVPVMSGGMVRDLGWSQSGLTWTSEPRFGDHGRTRYIMTPAGEVLAVTPEASPMATPGATPVASPVASPNATPVASPNATPHGTPVASPVG